MNKTTRIEFEGRTYDVVTDEAKRDQMLSQYCQVYRIRKDGKPGHMLTTIPLIFSLLQLVRTS